MDSFDTQRKRAWLLYEAENMEDANLKAQKIHEDLGNIGGDDKVVIRADVVIFKGVKILVPVDTSGDTALNNLKGEIKKITNNDPVMDALVENHYPAITYLAHGFVSRAEFDKADKDHKHPDKHGRIKRKSPGDNPWG